MEDKKKLIQKRLIQKSLALQKRKNLAFQKKKKLGNILQPESLM